MPIRVWSCHSKMVDFVDVNEKDRQSKQSNKIAQLQAFFYETLRRFRNG